MLSFEKFKEQLSTLSDVKEINKKLIKRYPFLKPRNVWTDKVVKNYDYSWTELDALGDIWKESFGLDLCEDIRDELLSMGSKSFSRFVQIKDGKLKYLETMINYADIEFYKEQHKGEEFSLEGHEVPYLKLYRVNQIKEKYGSLRWYSQWTTEDLETIISKYVKKSKQICSRCGKKAEYVSLGWVEYLCRDCAEKEYGLEMCDKLSE